jgi:hypothetical protein
MLKRRIYWDDGKGNRHFETITDAYDFRKQLDEVCDKAKGAGIYGHAVSEFINE